MKCPICNGTGRGALLDCSGNVIGCDICFGSGEILSEGYSRHAASISIPPMSEEQDRAREELINRYRQQLQSGD